MSRFPDLAIIGFPKSGTTPLVLNLTRDKHFHIPLPEPSFFLFDDNGRLRKSVLIRYPNEIDSYKSLFEDDKLCGDKTPHYIYNHYSLEKIKLYIPEIKIIICLRHPLQRFLSHFKHAYLDEQKNNNITLEQLVFEHYPNYVFNPNPSPNHLYYLISSLSNSYVFYLKKVYELFSHDKIYIIIQEKMQQDVESHVNKLADWLSGGTINNFVSGKRVGRGALAKNEFEYEGIDIYSEEFKKVIQEIYPIFKSQHIEVENYLGYKISEWEKYTLFYEKIYNNVKKTKT